MRIDKQHAKFEVISPYDVLEWHVTAYNRQGELFWQDWVDYLGYEAAATTAALGTDMCHDIQRFVALLVLAEDFKIVETGTVMIQRTAQWKQAGEWCDVWPTSA